MTTHDTSAAERFSRSSGHRYVAPKLYADRAAGSNVGRITATGRTNKAERQEVADTLATVTETAVVGSLTKEGDDRFYPVTFTVTHRIVPIKETS